MRNRFLESSHGSRLLCSLQQPSPPALFLILFFFLYPYQAECPPAVQLHICARQVPRSRQDMRWGGGGEGGGSRRGGGISRVPSSPINRN